MPLQPSAPGLNNVIHLAGKPPAPAPQAPRAVAGWWDVQAVAEVTGLSVSLIYQLVKARKFPAQVRVTPRCVRWKSAEVAAWMEAREAERTGGASQ